MANKIPKTMRAIGFYKYLPISDTNSLVDLEVKVPDVDKNEVLVQVKAVSVNPIDTKVRATFKPIAESTPRILGFDGSGIVVDKGENTKHFNIGDEVFFTGDLRNNGTNAEYVALEEIHVGIKPKNLTFEEAASVPIAAITAYETIYDRLLLSEKDKGKTFFIINSGGGVGSMASQSAKNLGLTVIGTASRKETEKFSLENGADIVLNHTQDLSAQLASHGYEKGVDFIMVNYDPFPYWDTLMKVIKPQGRICLIVDCSGLVDLRPLKHKSITLVSEMMGTRIVYNTEDKFRHHEMRQAISELLESGKLKPTLTKILSPINAANLREAHRLLENKRMVGKLVVTGFEQ